MKDTSIRIDAFSFSLVFWGLINKRKKGRFLATCQSKKNSSYLLQVIAQFRLISQLGFMPQSKHMNKKVNLRCLEQD